ncbi:MAG: thioredoxin family protein [Acidobacteriota bacterium]
MTSVPFVSTTLRRCLLGAAALLLALGPASAQNDSLFSGFKKVPELIVEVDGAQDQGAEIFYQVRIPAYVVVSDSLSSPALIMPRTKQVQSVSLMKMSRRGDQLDLAADAIFGTIGTFEQQGTSISFAADGKSFVMRDKPALLGLMRASGLEKYNSSYTTLAAAYSPDEGAMAVLKKDARDVRVRVYFGSWCPFCSRYVPRMIKVNQDLAGTNIKIDYYGLPRNFEDDKAVVDAMKLTGVPTGVVFIDGKEAGRIKGESWKAPEQSLKRIVEARR